MRKVLLFSIFLFGRCDEVRQVSGPHPDYFSQKRECYELSVKRSVRDEPKSVPGFIDLKPEQCYVPTMNTCICESGVMERTSGKRLMMVEDLLTGRELANGSAEDPTYKKERDQLFSHCAK
jgi:hypothetical protein